MGIIKLPVPWKPPPPSRFTVTNPGNYPSPLPIGFITKTAQLRVRGHRLPKFNKPPFVDCQGASTPATAQDAFKKVAKAWQIGGGYAWGDNTQPFTSIVQSDWHNMAASFQWYKGGGRYQKRTGFQWFQGYQLAAYSANLRNIHFGHWPTEADSLCFVAAPDGIYDPIEITAGNFQYTTNPIGGIPENVLTFFPTPNLGNFLPNVGPDPPYTYPPLIYDITPYTSLNKRKIRKPFFYNGSDVWWMSPPPYNTPGYLVGCNVWDATCEPNPQCYWRFRYVSMRGSYGDDVLQFSAIIPTQEPGPPFDIYGPAIKAFL